MAPVNAADIMIGYEQREMVAQGDLADPRAHSLRVDRDGERMHPLKLVQHMKSNANRMSEGLVDKIRGSDKCSEFLLRVPAEEHKQYALEIYRNLTDWLSSETDSIIEQRYIALGMRRAAQGVPFGSVFWGICIARDYLWDYMQQECLIEDPADFWGGVILLRSLNRFFDRTLYFILGGYQIVGKNELAGASAVSG